MAKRSRGSAKANQTAEQLGRLLGQVAARVDTWKAQRDAIRQDLGRIIATANTMLGELGESARRGRRTGRRTGPGSRNVSPAARAKMAAAARRRWARYRAEKGK